MADRIVGGECSAHISAKSKCNSDVIVCKRCNECEAQLKEALDELASIRMINELLQKELLTHQSLIEIMFNPLKACHQDTHQKRVTPKWQQQVVNGFQWYTASTKIRKRLRYQQWQLITPTCILIT